MCPVCGMININKYMGHLGETGVGCTVRVWREKVSICLWKGCHTCSNLELDPCSVCLTFSGFIKWSTSVTRLVYVGSRALFQLSQRVFTHSNFHITSECLIQITLVSLSVCTQGPSTWSTSCLMIMCFTCWSRCTARREPTTSWGPWRERAAQVRLLPACYSILTHYICFAFILYTVYVLLVHIQVRRVQPSPSN